MTKLLNKPKKILNENLIDINQEKGFTMLAQDIYPFQWGWDSAFASYGYAYFDIQKSIKEIRALFDGQWQNGMLPHMIFHKDGKHTTDKKF